MDDRSVGVLGARSLIGGCLLELLDPAGWSVTAFSRQVHRSDQTAIEWRQLPSAGDVADRTISRWISLLPIWALPQYFSLLESYGAQRVVAVSSTSRFVKEDSSDAMERQIAASLSSGELALQSWAERNETRWTVLRPTLVYGCGRDTTISEIARFIRHFGFFPLIDDGKGLRQPIHAKDVAKACMDSLIADQISGRAYNLSGASSLTYRDMVGEVFGALGSPSRFIPVPMWMARLLLASVRMLPRYRHWRIGMIERMGRDLVFDHAEATRDLGFKPQKFRVSAEEVSDPIRAAGRRK